MIGMPALPATLSTQNAKPLVAAQPAASPLSFDVVSVEQVRDSNARFQLRFTPDGFSARACPLKTLIVVAFDLRDGRLIEASAHDEEALYDVDAKVSQGDLAGFAHLSDVQKHAMLKGILAERFQLRYHLVPKEVPVYALVVDNGGLKMAAAKPNADGRIETTMELSGRYTVVAKGWTAGDFFQFLSELSGRYVVDRTGLTGRYDFTLRCAPDPGADPRENVEWDGPVIYTALREQLGLALQPSTEKFDAVVVDHVGAPTPN